MESYGPLIEEKVQEILEQAYDSLGFAQLETGDLMAARSSFESSLKIQPWNFKIRQKLAKILGNLNLFNEQEIVCRESMQMADSLEGFQL